MARTRLSVVAPAAAPVTSVAEALAYFERLGAVTVEQCIGRWRGAGYPTGHSLDGLLEAYGWYGKEFLSADRVHPLLFKGGDEIFPVDPSVLPIQWLLKNAKHVPRRVPAKALALAARFIRTNRPKARLRMIEYGGVLSAAMIYDHLPIIDVFRRIDSKTLLGLMDLRGMAEPFFFVLKRDERK